MGYVMECKNVTYTYPLADEPSIRNVSLNIEEGKFYGIVGENGSGKTTLCAILRGFAPSFYQGDIQGEVLVYGKPIGEYGGELATKIGYVFQNPFTQISGVKETVFEEVAYGLENFGVPVEEIVERVEAIMKLTHIDSLAEKNPLELSGGQMQRVALASVLVLEPDILIIDEPTSQLDPQGTESVFEIIKMMKDKKKTIILVEHKIDLIAEYADEVLVLRGGKLIAGGDKAQVLSDISLMEQGVQLPQMAILGSRLKEKGFPISEIPVTEKRAVEIISAALNGRDTQ
ncbi:MAG: ABC transporter ATP-binding protein [Firmicutes bacterium]|jgi:energy-coupling factor transporter ATP-binding protein EcfA2|nr:ABC transporter ATP-binding protein [Bacillota bacterium]